MSTSPTSATERLYRAAITADLAFSTELQRAYGAKASDARYLASHADPSVERAMGVKVHADALLRAALNGHGGKP